LSCVIGEADLTESVRFYGKDSPLTALVPKLDGVDPDDAYSTVPYDKGAHLLYYLEDLLGGEAVFGPYMRSYVNSHKGQSIGTLDWKEHLLQYFSENDRSKLALLNTIEWDKWLSAPGMPPCNNKYDERPQKKCLELAERWLQAAQDSSYSQFSPNDIKGFSTIQQVIFLTRLSESAPLRPDTLAAIDRTYELTGYRNCEVRFGWLALSLKSNYMQVIDAVIDMLSTQGRMKYTRPLYRLLHACPEGRDIAEQTFARLRNFYHPICTRMVEKDLEL
ncbi:Leucyl aminopeptidase yscIV, partial [Coemansia guatemalensis]